MDQESALPPKKSFLRRFGWILIAAIVIILLLVIIVILLRSNKFEKSDKNTDDELNSDKSSESDIELPQCPDNLEGIFTYQMIEPDKISALVPLGNVNGTSHILPVDHVYFKSYPTEENKHLAVYSPADMTITQLTLHKVVDNNGNIVAHEHDYAVDAEICEGLKVWILAINELAPVLQSSFDNGEKRHEEGRINQDEIAINDTFSTTYEIKAGELLGYTGQKGNGSSIEISIINENQEPDPKVDWDYYVDADRRSHIMCFADLYSGSQRDELYNKFGNYTDPEKGDLNLDISTALFIPRTIDPLCGEVIQNITGTIQGDWFYGKPQTESENLEGEGKVVSFIHLNTNPSIGVISIAGTITDSPMSVSYDPVHSGTINRESSEVQADGKIYCYKIENQESAGKILVQLLDDNNLRIEHKSGTCSSNESFDNSYTYER